MTRSVRTTRWVVVMVLVTAALSATVGLAETTAPSEDSAQESSEAPAIAIVAPETGCIARVGDVLDVMLILSEGLDVSAVAVLCDSRGVGMLQEAPYAVKWDTADIPPGDHVLRAFAYLKSGEKLAAEPVVLTLTVAEASQASPASASEREPVVLREGTPILLHTEEKMVSGRTAEGSAARFRVARDIVGPGRQVLIGYGDLAQGRVTRSRRRGMFGKAGQLEFTVDSVTAVDGTTVPLRASEEMGGKDNTGTVIASALLLTVLAIFVHGKDVDLPAGTEFTAYVDHDTAIGSPLPPRAPGAGTGTGALVQPFDEPAESVVISRPADGRHVRQGNRLEVMVDVKPKEKFLSLKLFANGNEVASQEKELAPITLDTGRQKPGEYTLEAEVRFSNGRRVRSEPVRIVIVEGE